MQSSGRCIDSEAVELKGGVAGSAFGVFCRDKNDPRNHTKPHKQDQPLRVLREVFCLIRRVLNGAPFWGTLRLAGLYISRAYRRFGGLFFGVAAPRLALALLGNFSNTKS